MITEEYLWSDVDDSSGDLGIIIPYTLAAH